METRVVLSVGGRGPVGTMFVPEGATARPGLLFLHGFFSDRSGYRERAEAVVEQLGAVCLTFDLSAHGESPGELTDLTPRDHLDEVVAAYDLLAAHPAVDPDRIGVCGASFGGFLGASLTGRRAVRKLLLRAPALYPDDALDRRYGGPRPIEAVECLATRALRDFKGDALIVESGAEETIPPEVIALYRAVCPEARGVVIPGAAHALTEAVWRECFLAEILKFFREGATAART
ncbi:alpha/beta hydrolase family protein [Actinoplanes sp. HUAS TT8]|uniref:alpha/beta hydrolase family protein n=1 Tax=Actinoplanes sp. HUAS TT8 TaxID=3447453 RepID=UPI003F5251DD